MGGKEMVMYSKSIGMPFGILNLGDGVMESPTKIGNSLAPTRSTSFAPALVSHRYRWRISFPMAHQHQDIRGLT